MHTYVCGSGSDVAAVRSAVDREAEDASRGQKLRGKGEVQFSLGKGPFSLDTCISDVSHHVSKPLAPNTFRIHARYVSRHDTLQDTLEYVHSERFGTPKFGIHCDTVGYVRDT